MAIHHTHHKQAQKMGIQLTESGSMVRGFWPQFSFMILAANGPEVIKQMRAAQAVMEGGDYRMDANGRDMTKVDTFRVADGAKLVGSPMVPLDAYDAIKDGDAEWEDMPTPPSGIPPHVVDPASPMEEVTGAPAMPLGAEPKSVPMDGAEAYKAGFTAADCPYPEDHPQFGTWNDEYDTAAEEAVGEPPPDEEEVKVGSVVKPEYRARYAEAGHPTHCGDELAILINNLCAGKEGTDLKRFEAICEANGVSLAKYNRVTNGWQGRLRMTGRNMLARVVFTAGGVLKTPIEGVEPEYRLSADWMARQRFGK